MGSTVLNGTGWPLNRRLMAEKLGFDGIIENAFDATQGATVDLPLEFTQVMQSIALHSACFIQDVMVQYAQPRPWMILGEGDDTTYVSSAMPQKRNPGLMNNTRRDGCCGSGFFDAQPYARHAGREKRREPSGGVREDARPDVGHDEDS